MRTEKEINEVLSKLDTEQTKYPSMTYEQGVQESLQWILGEISNEEFAPTVKDA